MASWLARCCGRTPPRTDVNDDQDDLLLWSNNLLPHYIGEFSAAIVQANLLVEDQLQVETFRCGTFVGVYDGHGGDDCSTYVAQRLFKNFLRIAKENPNGTVGNAIRDAFMATDNEFLRLVERSREENPLIAAAGSCGLVGVIWEGKVYVANAGDSRAVLGRLVRNNQIVAQQLSEDHNPNNASAREALISSHSDDPNIVVQKNGVWRVKGIIQLTRALGDGYLKRADFALPAEHTRFQLPAPLQRPALTAEPSIQEHTIQPEDKFLIFASDGLWDCLSNQQAADIVFASPRAHQGIARRLIRTAMQVIENRCGLRYELIKMVAPGERRACHDDISVVVVYIEHEMAGSSRGHSASAASVSVRGFANPQGPSEFTVLDEVER
ncbi:putative protein phosphatase 2C 25 [Nymphaea thermarum]|nr:putative protein phosphatase 2C 25 [Nymphaea thermarum]